MKTAFAHLMLVIAIIALSEAASAAPRKYLYFGGVGSGRSAATMSSEAITGSAQFTGWGAHGIGGIEMPFSNEFAVTFAGLYTSSDMTNAAQSSTMHEDSNLTHMAARIGLKFTDFEIGGGYGNASMNTKMFTTGGTAYEAKLTGLVSHGYAAMNFDVERRIRFQVAGEYFSGKVSDWNLTGYRATLNMLVIF